jgi:hypothetical protein
MPAKIQFTKIQFNGVGELAKLHQLQAFGVPLNHNSGSGDEYP